MWTRNLSYIIETNTSVQTTTAGSGSDSCSDTLKLSFLPLGLLLLFLSLFGIIANVLSAIVMLRPRMNSTYSTLTLGLTFCDTIFLVTKLLRYGFQSMFTYFSVAREYTHVFYPITGAAMKAITATSHTGLTYFTVAVAADRYFVVCWSAYARRFWSIKRSFFVSIGVLAFSILYNLPQWWEFESVLVPAKNGTEYYYKMRCTAFRQNRAYRVPYKIVHVIIMNFIPFLLLVFMNWKIWRKMQEARQIRRSLTSVQRKEKSFTGMLISVVILFLVCSSVYFVKDFLEITKLVKKTPATVKNIGNILLTFNSAVNFLLYCMFGSRFRQEFARFYKDCLSSCYYRCILRQDGPIGGSRYDLSTTNAPTPSEQKKSTSSQNVP